MRILSGSIWYGSLERDCGYVFRGNWATYILNNKAKLARLRFCELCSSPQPPSEATTVLSIYGSFFQ